MKKKKRSEDLVHKASNDQSTQTLCGRYGYRASLWKTVTCDVCLMKKPK